MKKNILKIIAITLACFSISPASFAQNPSNPNQSKSECLSGSLNSCNAYIVHLINNDKDNFSEIRKFNHISCWMGEAMSCSNYASNLQSGIGGEKNTDLSKSYFEISCWGKFAPACGQAASFYASEGKENSEQARFLKARACSLGANEFC